MEKIFDWSFSTPYKGTVTSLKQYLNPTVNLEFENLETYVKGKVSSDTD